MRTLTIVLLSIFASTLPALADGGEPPPELILKQVLQLDDAQVQEIQQLAALRGQAISPLVTQLQQLEQSLAAELESASPDPAHAGAVLLSIRAVRRQIEQHELNHRQAFLDLLNEEQRKKVEQIRGVEAAMHAAAALHRVGA